MSELVLSIDAGTTGVTVLVIDGDTNVRGRAYSEFQQHFPRPGWVEHDATEIWEVTSRLLTEALSDAGASASDLAGIGITNQRETSVLWNRSTGEPIAPAIVWQCRRTSALCERIRDDAQLENELRTRTGLVVDPYFSHSQYFTPDPCQQFFHRRPRPYILPLQRLPRLFRRRQCSPVYLPIRRQRQLRQLHECCRDHVLRQVSHQIGA